MVLTIRIQLLYHHNWIVSVLVLHMSWLWIIYLHHNCFLVLLLHNESFTKRQFFAIFLIFWFLLIQFTATYFKLLQVVLCVLATLKKENFNKERFSTSWFPAKLSKSYFKKYIREVYSQRKMCFRPEKAKRAKNLKIYAYIFNKVQQLQ